MQTGWDEEVGKVKAKAEELRKAAVQMNDEDTADWYEAYAANMTNYAKQMQEEASQAVAAAAEARAKADASKKA